MKKFTVFIIVCTCLIFNGCTKLEEKVLDESSATGLSDRAAAEGLIAPVYALLPSLFTHTNYFTLQEISTDEAILPYRGGTDWGDNGIYLSMHSHNFSSTDPNIRNTWNLILQSMSRSITAINSLPSLRDGSVKTFLAEARGIRAYYSMLTLDFFWVGICEGRPGGKFCNIKG